MSAEPSLAVEPLEKKGIKREKKVSHCESLRYIYIICIIIGRLLLLIKIFKLGFAKAARKKIY